MKIFVVNGKPRSGKNTFVDFCKEQIGKNYVLDVSTVDFVKQIAKECGWNGEKTPKDRKFLSDLKKVLIEWNNVPYNKVIWKIKEFQDDMLSYGVDPDKYGWAFIQCREPEEIRKFVNTLHANTILVIGGLSNEDDLSNDSDRRTEEYDYDYIIDNYGSLDQLKEQAKKFLKYA